MATVVYFRASAPSAHCAKVTASPPAVASASRTGGYSHNGACSANRGHHAAPVGSPQSAGFSTIHDAPAPCAARTRAAVKSASALCLRRYCTHLRGVGCTPPGCALVRSRGVCATEKEEQGGAANTAPNCPARTQPSTLAATSGRAKLWSCPPSAMSI
eukprot:1624623-Pleurochrysis_carterae.AAC.1